MANEERMGHGERTAPPFIREARHQQALNEL